MNHASKTASGVGTARKSEYADAVSSLVWKYGVMLGSNDAVSDTYSSASKIRNRLVCGVGNVVNQRTPMQDLPITCDERFHATASSNVYNKIFRNAAGDWINQKQ